MLEQWLVELITSWRQRIQGVSSSQLALLRSWERFDVPCQAEVWHMTHRRAQLDCQLIAFSHLVKLPDLQIVIHKNFSPRKASATFSRVLRKSYLWSSHEERALLENRIILFFRGFKDYISNLTAQEAIHPHITNRSPLSDNVFLWFVRGNIEKLDPNRVLDEIFEAARRRESEPDHAELVEGLGTYFYPPVWIGKKPKYTVSRLNNRLYDTVPLRDPVIDVPIITLKWDEIKILIFSDGFIFIGEQREERALFILNWIMASAALKGLSCFALKQADLLKATYVGYEQPFLLKVYTTSPLSPRAMPAEPLPHLAPVIELERKTIPQSVISEIVESAKCLADGFANRWPVLVLEAQSYFRSGDYVQSFIAAWWVIESSLYSLLEEVLVTRKHTLNRKRKEKLLVSGQWTVDDVLEVLEILKAVDHSEYTQLQDLKRWRNRLIHGRSVQNIDELRRYAESCIDSASKIVEKAIGHQSCSHRSTIAPC